MSLISLVVFVGAVWWFIIAIRRRARERRMMDYSPPPAPRVEAPSPPRPVPPEPPSRPVPPVPRPLRRPRITSVAGLPERWAVIDVETTGGSDPQIVEFGCIILDDRFEELTRWETLVKPSIDINPFAQRVHGITKSMLRDAPPFLDVADDIQLLINGAWIAGHNVSFDLSMLDREYRRLGGAVYREGAYYDTLFDFTGKLENIAERHNIEFSEIHRAIADSVVVTKLMRMVEPGVPGDVLCIDFTPDMIRPDGLTREEALPMVKCDASPVVLREGDRITLTGISGRDKTDLESKLTGRGFEVGDLRKKQTKAVVARHLGGGTGKEVKAREWKIPVISFNQACGLLHVGTTLGTPKQEPGFPTAMEI